jgi:hypothetical protein
VRCATAAHDYVKNVDFGTLPVFANGVGERGEFTTNHLCGVTEVVVDAVFPLPYLNIFNRGVTSSSVRLSVEIEIEIVHNMCRQTGPTVVSRATLLRHSGLVSKLGPGLFDQVHLSAHQATLCVDVPREL